jgi:hypothetical protein
MKEMPFAGDLASRGSNYTQHADQINKYLKSHEYSPSVSVYGWGSFNFPGQTTTYRLGSGKHKIVFRRPFG